MSQLRHLAQGLQVNRLSLVPSNSLATTQCRCQELLALDVLFERI